MRRLFLLLVSLLLAASAWSAPPQAGARPDHVPDGECLSCHVEQGRLWQDSKHRRAMQPADASTVLADFSGVRFAGKDETARFLRRGDAYLIRATGADSREAEFPVSHTFGVYPLQQYLLPQPGGRLQAFTIAWDVRRKAWFSLYPEGGIAPGSNLHWSGRYQNWNLMCGECHTTAFRKGYDDAADRYATTWAEGNVGCQACHGGSKAHADSARNTRAGHKPQPTLNRALAEPHAQVDQCAACHARRTRLTEEARPGEPLLDHFMPDNLRADLYHADGQQLEEVFEYGSYRQSRMYQAGVGCTSCHDPHSGKLRAEGNALCVSCHSPNPPKARFASLQARDYDSPAHHFHAAGQAGSQCVDCHMPSRNYMIVHERRDHAIRIPRPDLSARLGTPNACQACHADRSPQWAAEAIICHHGPRQHPPHYGERLAAARAGAPGAADDLRRLIEDVAQPAIVRATAIETLAQLGAAPPAVALTDADPVVRAAAAAAQANRPADERLARLSGLLSDPLRGVRITAARVLADLPDERLPPGLRPLQRAALQEFVAAQQAMADMPSAQLNLASLYRSRKDPEGAERHYRRALEREPALQAARLGLASLLAGSGREPQAVELLKAGIPLSAQPGELHLALGLLAGQRRQWAEAEGELATAVELMPGNAQARRNLEALRNYLRQSGAR